MYIYIIIMCIIIMYIYIHNLKPTRLYIYIYTYTCYVCVYTRSGHFPTLQVKVRRAAVQALGRAAPAGLSVLGCHVAVIFHVVNGY